MTLKEFITKYTDKGIDYDGHFGFQCVDLYRQYVQEVLQLPQSPGVRGAADIWDNYLKEHYERIDNSPEAVPEAGDIIIWDKNAGGGFGHVAVFVDGDVSKFTSFDQNWPTSSKPHLQNHYYKNVLGWIRPKDKPNDALATCLAQHTKLVDEAVAKDKEIDELKETNIRIKDERTACENSKSSQLQQLAEKLDTVPEFPEIMGKIEGLLGVESDLTEANSKVAKQAEDITRLSGVIDANLATAKLKEKELRDEITARGSTIEVLQEKLRTMPVVAPSGEVYVAKQPYYWQIKFGTILLLVISILIALLK